jgi:hypothetical protein
MTPGNGYRYAGYVSTIQSFFSLGSYDLLVWSIMENVGAGLRSRASRPPIASATFRAQATIASHVEAILS